MRRPIGEEGATIHQLVAAVLRAKDLSDGTKKAAQAADKAEQDVEKASMRDARRTRDAVAQRWEAALGVLRHAIAAADEGAPEL
jgi:hypothetical protein